MTTTTTSSRPSRHSPLASLLVATLLLVLILNVDLTACKGVRIIPRIAGKQMDTVYHIARMPTTG